MRHTGGEACPTSEPGCITRWPRPATTVGTYWHYCVNAAGRRVSQSLYTKIENDRPASALITGGRMDRTARTSNFRDD
jgi:hypothetical protein